MIIKKLFFGAAFFISLMPYQINAQPHKIYNDCIRSIDAIGCFLDGAKNKAIASKTIKEQANLVGRVLVSYGGLHRTDYDLVSKAAMLSNNKNLSVSEYLDLQTSIATYFFRIDPEKAKKHLENASKLYLTALSENRKKDRQDIHAWACGLIDLDPGVWRELSHITASTCTLKLINEVEISDEMDKLVIGFQKVQAAWVQSDYEELEKQRQLFMSNIKEVEDIGIKLKNEKINQSTQYFKTYSFLALAELYRRSRMKNEADKFFAQAQEAISGLEKIGDGKFAIEAKIQLINYHNSFLEYDKALEVINGLVSSLELKKPVSKFKIENDSLVDFMLAAADANARGGFASSSDAITWRTERQRRQSDVLYNIYSFLERNENSSSLPSEETLRALFAAAKAGNPLAMHNLGVAYSHGLYGIAKNLTEARYWYYVSAINGFAGAQNNLGDLYEESEDQPDIGLAIYWYTQSAMQGEPTAYLSLGSLFFEGKGVRQNFLNAAFWLSLAAEHLSDGDNKEKAIKYKELAVSKLDENAKRHLYSRIFNFTPLKQTLNPIGDKPKLGDPS